MESEQDQQHRRRPSQSQLVRRQVLDGVHVSRRPGDVIDDASAAGDCRSGERLLGTASVETWALRPPVGD